VVVPLRIGQLPRFTRAARPIIEELAASVAAMRDHAEPEVPREAIAVATSTALDWIEKHGDRVIDAMAAATDRDRQWIAEGATDEFLLLVVEVVSVNLDFFSRRLLPNLKGNALGARDLVRQAINGSGRTPSKSSSKRVTS
jgi:hypothetical protein